MTVKDLIYGASPRLRIEIGLTCAGGAVADRNVFFRPKKDEFNRYTKNPLPAALMELDCILYPSDDGIFAQAEAKSPEMFIWILMTHHPSRKLKGDNRLLYERVSDAQLQSYLDFVRDKTTTVEDLKTIIKRRRIA